MQPFNLDRFKAGEPAYNTGSRYEYFFLADLPDGRIAIKYLDNDGWRCSWLSIAGMENIYYMIEKELTWEDVCNMWANDKIDRTLFFGWLEENFEPLKRKKK